MNTPATKKIAAKKLTAKPTPTRKATSKAVVKQAAAAPKAKTSAKAAAKPLGKTSPKPAKLKLVRDSFTMPSDEYAALAQLKQRALAFAHPAKKSELLRAGIKLLAGLGDAALMRALKGVPTIKTGRPKSGKSA